MDWPSPKDEIRILCDWNMIAFRVLFNDVTIIVWGEGIRSLYHIHNIPLYALDFDSLSLCTINNFLSFFFLCNIFANDNPLTYQQQTDSKPIPILNIHYFQT